MAFVNTGPTIRFSQMCWQKMWALVHACDIEISWMMILATEEERQAAGVTEPYYFSDVYVVDQECDGTNTDMVDGAVGELVNQLMNESIDPGRLKGYGHSHPTFSVEPSGKDEKTFERLELEPLVSIILNKSGDVYLRLDQWEPFRHSYKCNYVVDQVQMIPDSWGAEMVKEHVTRFKPKTKYNWSVGKGKGKSTVSYGRKGYTNWDDLVVNQWHRNEGVYMAEVEFDDDDDVIEEPGIDKKLSLPRKFDLLQEAYEEGIIDINDVIEKHGRVCSGEMTTQEMDSEIEELLADHDFGTSIYADDEDDEEETKIVVGVGA